MGKPGSMDDLADEAGAEADEALLETELKMLAETTLNVAALRPKVSDQATYDKLFGPVAGATDTNKRLALLKSRLAQLGKEGLKVAREVIQLVNKK